MAQITSTSMVMGKAIIQYRPCDGDKEATPGVVKRVLVGKYEILKVSGEGLTAMKVAGRNVIVSTAIDFIAKLSLLASIAIRCEEYARLRLIWLLLCAKWLLICRQGCGVSLEVVKVDSLGGFILH